MRTAGTDGRSDPAVSRELIVKHQGGDALPLDVEKEREVFVRSSNVWICGAVAITLMHLAPAPATAVIRCARGCAGDVIMGSRAGTRAASGATPPRHTKAAAPKGTAPSATGDGALRQRVEQLEEQLVDMQVLVGTLKSLARGGGGAPPRGLQQWRE